MSRNNLISLSLIFFSIFNVTSCYAASVGDSYGGGTVFCVSKTPDITKCVTEGSGDYGLIMANEDQVNYDSNDKHGITWASEKKTTGAQSFNDGASNTNAIIKTHPKDDSSNNAAWLCHNYKDKVEGHTDWYLPSKNELNKMYLYAGANDLIGKDCKGSKVNGVQCLIGGYDNDIVYWSSSESSGNFTNAWSQAFSNYNQYYHGKIDNDFGARAVRAFQQFNNLSIQQVVKSPHLEEQPVVVNNAQTVSVGDSYGGGTVFCVSKNKILNSITKCDINECTTVGSGDCGLIMANEDQVNYDSNSKYGITWASEYKTTGAQSHDNGASNTDVIIRAHPKDDSSNNAAWLCHNYKDKIEGHTDWYLPSKNELNKMYLYAKVNNLIGKNCKGSKVNGVQCLIGGYDDNYKIYWSSSEYSGYDYGAWVQYFSNGFQYYENKIYLYLGARAVRAFSNKLKNSGIKQFNNNSYIEVNEKIKTDINVPNFDFLKKSEI